MYEDGCFGGAWRTLGAANWPVGACPRARRWPKKRNFSERAETSWGVPQTPNTSFGRKKPGFGRADLEIVREGVFWRTLGAAKWPFGACPRALRWPKNRDFSERAGTSWGVPQTPKTSFGRKKSGFARADLEIVREGVFRRPYGACQRARWCPQCSPSVAEKPKLLGTG